MDNFQIKEFQKKYHNTCARVLNLVTDKISGIQFSQIPGSISINSPSVTLAGNWKKKVLPREKILAGNFITNKTFKLKDIKVLPPPEKQVFDWNGRTIVYSKNPQRQWALGVNHANSMFSDPLFELVTQLPLAPLVKRHFMVNISSQIKLLENLFTENHAIDIKRAIVDIGEYKLLSRTLDKTYFLSLSINENYPYVLYRYETPVAYYDNKEDCFTLMNHMFAQEVYDFCRRRNYPSTIKEV